MTHLRNALLCALLASLALLALSVAWTVYILPEMVAGIIADEAEATRQSARAAINDALFVAQQEIAATRQETLAVVRSTTVDAKSEITALRADLRAEIGSTRTGALMRLDALTSIFCSQLTETNRHIGTVMQAYAGIPTVVGERVDEFTDCRRNGLCWQGQISDTLFAARMAARSVATAAPEMAKTAQRIADNSDRTTASTAGMMRNFEQATKPLPWWARLTLQVAPAAGQVALPFVIGRIK